MGFHVIIPARYDAQRLPGKPLREIGGKTLIQWVYEAARSSRADRVVVATDDQRIAVVVSGFGGEVCMTSREHRSGTDRIAQAADDLDLGDDEIVVNLQGDEPMMQAAMIEMVADALARDPGMPMATAAHPIADDMMFHDPNVVKVVCDEKSRALYFSRAPIPFPRDGDAPRALHHIGLYAYRVRFLRQFTSWPVCPLESTERLEQLRALYNGAPILVCTSDSAPDPGIDTEQDLERYRRTVEK